ncbi:class I SAM-dependent methyltransferase [Polynucleobacter paneuropaeus]|nr:class I SAM-dependent methyltransferase [Polynucleobacter paneuropaeus]
MKSSQVDRQPQRYEPIQSDPYYELNASITKLLKPIGHILRNQSVLDFGCGERSFNKFFHDFSIDVIGCDISQNQSGTVDIVIDATKKILPFKDGNFDAIFLFDVLEHLPNDAQVLKELNRMLRNEGLLIMSVPFMYRFHEVPNDYRMYTPSGLAYVLAQAGFYVQEITPIGSSFLVVDTMLRESGSKFTGFWHSIARRLVLKVLVKFKAIEDPCPVSPLSFFVLAVKRGLA